MIEEFDKLAITTENYDKLSDKEKKDRVAKRKQLLSKMSNEELSQLLERPYPAQFKKVIKDYIK